MMMRIKMRMAITTVAAESYCWNQTIARLTAANPCHQLQPLDPINYICQIYQHIWDDLIEHIFQVLIVTYLRSTNLQFFTIITMYNVHQIFQIYLRCLCVIITSLACCAVDLLILYIHILIPMPIILTHRIFWRS